MADGGAWNSEVFDVATGRNDKQGAYGRHHQGPAGGDHVAVGVPPPMYNQPPASIAPGTWSTIISISLRIAALVFSTVAFAIIASNKGEKEYATYNLWTDSFTYVWLKWKMIKNSGAAFLLGANVILCFYSLVQLVVSMVRGCLGARLLSGPTTPAGTITFAFDQVMTYMMMGACGAATEHAVYIRQRDTADGQDVCDTFQVFCDKQISSIAISFFAFLCIALSVVLHNVRWYKMAKKMA